MRVQNNNKKERYVYAFAIGDPELNKLFPGCSRTVVYDFYLKAGNSYILNRKPHDKK
jgi:hypothetical protein